MAEGKFVSHFYLSYVVVYAHNYYYTSLESRETQKIFPTKNCQIQLYDQNKKTNEAIAVSLCFDDKIKIVLFPKNVLLFSRNQN